MTAMIDDVDPAIEYDASWFVAHDFMTGVGTRGPPLGHTLHGTNVKASATFSYEGQGVLVWGTVHWPNNTSRPEKPFWTCTIDGSTIPSKDPPTQPENDWYLCGSTFSQIKRRTLRFEVTPRDDGASVWLDTIEYTPKVSPQERRPFGYGHNGARFVYSSGWNLTESSAGHRTQTSGASVELPFTGTSVEWYGDIPGNVSTISSRATYSIDGSTPTTFYIPAPTSTISPLQRNHLLFRSPDLPNGSHRLQVVHQSTTSSVPLVLNYVLVRDISVEPVRANKWMAPRQVNAIVGAFIGGLFGITLLLKLLVCTRRSRWATSAPPAQYTPVPLQSMNNTTQPTSIPRKDAQQGDDSRLMPAEH